VHQIELVDQLIQSAARFRQRSQIGHQHNGNARSADVKGEQLAARMVDPGSEERLVPFDSKVRNKGEAGAIKEHTRDPRTTGAPSSRNMWARKFFTIGQTEIVAFGR